MNRSVIILVLAIILPCKSALADEIPGYNDILKTIFHDEEVSVDKKGKIFRIGSKYEIDNRGDGINICRIDSKKDSDRILFLALKLIPIGGDPWDSTIVCSVVGQRKGTCTLLHKTIVPLSEKSPHEAGYYKVDGVRTVRLIDRNMVILEYSFGDSISTPRGWHTITKLIDFADGYRPKEVWSLETQYSYGGSSQPQKKKTVQYAFEDINGDGFEEIRIKTTTVEDDVLIWDDSRFVKPDSYPPEPFQK